MHSVVLTGGASFCNAVRRTLISEVSMWAPYEVEMRSNTSCETDEYLAHRIGLIPFRKVGNGDEARLCKKGPCIVRASDVESVDFEVIHPEIEVITLAAGHELDIRIFFNKKNGKEHARYSPCAAVGMKCVDGQGRHKISFETNDKRGSKETVLEALDILESHIDTVLLSLAKQPDPPPRSMC